MDNSTADKLSDQLFQEKFLLEEPCVCGCYVFRKALGPTVTCDECGKPYIDAK